MLEEERKELNNFLAATFNAVLKLEETALKKSSYSDITIKELQLLQVVYERGINGGDNTAGAIAREMKITPGTLTTAVKLLEKKGYLQRVQDTKDKRSVHILVTEKGEKANIENLEFHGSMAESVSKILTEEEMTGFKKGLGSLVGFFKEMEKNNK
ncbi:MAG: MarR family transcriptional regulator [Bacillota bacterium]|nr:MarR family transcriptional regulator [Bacillota bacterium]